MRRSHRISALRLYSPHVILEKLFIRLCFENVSIIFVLKYFSVTCANTLLLLGRKADDGWKITFVFYNNLGISHSNIFFWGEVLGRGPGTIVSSLVNHNICTILQYYVQYKYTRITTLLSQGLVLLLLTLGWEWHLNV